MKILKIMIMVSSEPSQRKDFYSLYVQLDLLRNELTTWLSSKK